MNNYTREQKVELTEIMKKKKIACLHFIQQSNWIVAQVVG